MVQVSAKEITNLYLYGQSTTPSNLEDDSLIRDSTVPNIIKEIDTSEFMETGPGRFAVGSQFELVQKFFDPDFAVTSETDTEDKTYTKEELAKEFGLSTYGWSMYQFNFVDPDENNQDYIERSYIWNSMSFQISNSAEFVVTPNGDKFIKNFGVEPRDRKKLDKGRPDENFDFVGGGPVARKANEYLEPRIDPSRIGRTVDINFIDRNKLPKKKYTLSDYNADKKRNSKWDISTPIALAKLGLGRGKFVQNLFTSGEIKFLDSTNRPILYGTPESDSMSPLLVREEAKGSPTILTAPMLNPYKNNGLVFIGGAGADNIQGWGIKNNKLDGGDGNDTLGGGIGDDVFIGGRGNDKIEGDSLFRQYKGTDSSIYKGTLDEYEIEFLPDDTVRITDRVGDRDGSDLLEGVDEAIFSDKTIDLSPGQDIAFVIDTTSSMRDDIDAVKARASEIINTIFDGDSGFLDSQIAVVGYNDPSTNTFLSFTEQPKIEDRKNAAIKAINSISVGGGGDWEEAVNAGLIRALSGGAGEWREEADVRRIILFGDAPPKDTELRSKVLKLAANVGVNISNRKALSITGDIETSSITSDLSITRFALETENSGGTTVATPVEIFSVLIGNDSSTEADFQSLADATGGELFSADNASQVVDVLIEAIQTPIVPNISIENTTGPVMEGDEGTTNAIFTVNLSVPSEETIEIGYDTDPSIIRTTVFRPNEAINGEDYKDTSGVLKFNPGEITKTFTVPIIGDTKRELDDLLTVYLVDSNSIDKKITFNTKILSSTRLTIKNDDTGFSKQSFDIIENSKNGTVIGNLNVNNHWVFEYAEMPQLTFKITNNVDPDNDGNSAFSLDGDRLIVNDSDDLDYETNPILNISIEASDGELTNEATVTINLTDVDDNGETDGTFAPSQIAYSNNFTVNKGGWVSQDKYPRHVADVNGDGRDDIVGFGYNEVYVSLGETDGTFAPSQIAYNNNFTVNKGGWISQDKYPRHVADVNGDGRDDIVGFGYNEVSVSLGETDGTFAPSQIAYSDNFTVNKGDWVSQDKYPRHVANVNGDGRDDIVGFGYNEVYVSLGETDGTFTPSQKEFNIDLNGDSLII